VYHQCRCPRAAQPRPFGASHKRTSSLQPYRDRCITKFAIFSNYNISSTHTQAFATTRPRWSNTAAFATDFQPPTGNIIGNSAPRIEQQASKPRHRNGRAPHSSCIATQLSLAIYKTGYSNCTRSRAHRCTMRNTILRATNRRVVPRTTTSRHTQWHNRQ
jgi:hypothetical protein